jgi:hypothetical protein
MGQLWLHVDVRPTSLLSLFSLNKPTMAESATLHVMTRHNALFCGGELAWVVLVSCLTGMQLMILRWAPLWSTSI